jgi:hypothetical protein
MKALISPQESYRIADIHETGFDVAEPLFWVDCPDDIKSHVYSYDPENNTLKKEPTPEEPEPEQLQE